MHRSGRDVRGSGTARAKPLSASIVCADLPQATLFAGIAHPRGVCQVGEELLVLDRNRGTLVAIDLKSRKPRQVWAGPDLELGPFLGPTYEPMRRELIVSAVGCDVRNRRTRSAGALLAVSLTGQARVIAGPPPRGTVLERALLGVAGTVSVGDGQIAVSAVWGQRVSLMDTADGSTVRTLANLSRIGAAPNALAYHTSGTLLACDQARGRVLAISLAADGRKHRPYVLAAEIMNPICVILVDPKNAVILSKDNGYAYRVRLAVEARRLTGSAPEPIGRVPVGKVKGGIAIVTGRLIRLILAVDGEDELATAGDGLYELTYRSKRGRWQGAA